MMSWCSVRPSRKGTRTMARRACSVALRIASGTSRALPAPWPTRPLPSPTTTSAAKPNRRPPFTTLATRLIETSFSTSSTSWPSRSLSRSRPPRSLPSRAIPELLEIQAGFARGVSQRTDPPMKNVAAAIEADFRDAGGLGTFGNQLADRLGRVEVGAALDLLAELGVERRGCRQRAFRLVVDHLGIDVMRTAMHG